MNKPELYHKSHRVAKQEVGEIIKEYFSKFQWRPEGGDALLDVGTGPGDVSMDYIYPLLPANFGKIVFSDISADMLDYAKAYYGTPNKSEFKVLDIATKAPLPSELEGNFDHITSMLVMHWVKATRTALQNKFNLLRPEGGDCLMVFISANSIFHANHAMSKCPKWSQYIEDVDRFVSPFHYSQDPQSEFAQLMEEAGFCNIVVDLKPKTYHYGDVENFKENIKPVCGILDFIPTTCQDEFLDDYMAAMSEYAVRSRNLDHVQSQYTVTCDFVVAYGESHQYRRIEILINKRI